MNPTADVFDAAELCLRRSNPEMPEVVSVARRRSEWSTSRMLDELDMSLADGSVIPLLAKCVGSAGLLAEARRVRPSFLIDEDREIELYRSVLTGARLGTPVFYGEIAGEEGGRRLLIERVQGRELHEFADIEVWKDVAKWLARFQDFFAGEPVETLAPSLIRYDRAWLSIWPARAEIACSGIASTRKHRRFEQILERYERILDGLMAMPTALLHGELYSSNVLIEQSPDELRVCVVDWETAGVGPALIDLAALTAGSWNKNQRRRIAGAYFAAATPGTWASLDEVLAGLDLCLLHLAVQWLGWASDWSPPARNDCDWLDVAVRTADQLHL